MKQTLKINCGTGEDAYEVILTAKNEGVFLAACADPDVQKRKAEGEALVDAILKAALGSISKVERLKDGILNDGPDSRPARLWLDDKGNPSRITHYKNGLRNDAENGDPAVQWFGKASSGKVYCRDGKRHDGPRGEPSVQRFDKSKKLVRAVSCKGKKRIKIPGLY